MDIEISLRLGRATFSRQAKEQIAFTENVMGIPIQVSLVDFKARNVLLCVPIQTSINQLIEESIQLAICHNRSFLLNLLVIVNNLVHVNVVLIVAVIEDDELTGNGGHDILQSCLNQRKQKVCILLRHRQEKAQIVLHIFSSQAELYIQTICGQTVHTQRINNLDCQRFISWLRESTINNVLQLPAGSNDTIDGYITLQQSIGLDCRPVIIERNNARCIFRHFCIKNIPNSRGNILQNVSVLNQVNLIKHINVRRMNRIQIYKLLQARGHTCIEIGELLQMLTNQGLLLR